jgi:hypothetical protein
MAMRRTSWIDHRINDDAAMVLFLLWFGAAFFWLWRISMMADHRHHGKGEHYHRHVAMPAMPGSALVVIEAELVFCSLKTVLDHPAMAFDQTSVSMAVPAGHQVVKKARSSSAMLQKLNQPVLAHTPEEVLHSASSIQFTFRVVIATVRASNASCGPGGVETHRRRNRRSRLRRWR